VGNEWLLFSGLWFHDQLEALATLRQSDFHRTVTGEIVRVSDQIVDVYACESSRFLKLKGRTEIRLDRLISVNGNPTRFAQSSIMAIQLKIDRVLQGSN